MLDTLEPRELEETQENNSIDIQVLALKEVAMSLLHQLDAIRKSSIHKQQLEGRTLQDEVREFEIDLINSALARTHGHQRKAARLLGLKVTTLNAKMKRYHIMSRFYVPVDEAKNDRPLMAT